MYRAILTGFFLAGQILALSLSAQSQSEDWPEFRGRNGQGLADGARFPVEWTATRNVAWKQSVPGNGWSSPVLKNGRIYLTTSVQATNGNLSLRTLCLKESTGGPEWEKEVFSIPSG